MVKSNKIAPEIRFRTPHMKSLLAAAYPPGEWALMLEVAARTGGGSCYTDAVAVNLWQSRSYAVHGFEVKVSRADWKKELTNPRKNDEVMGYCDFFWVFAAPGIVDPAELPIGWGLKEPAQKRGVALPAEMSEVEASVNAFYGMKTIVEAKRLEAKPITREFFASIMRRSYESLDKIAENKLQDRISGYEKTFHERVMREVNSRDYDRGSLEKYAQKFKEQTGVDLAEWSAPSPMALQLAKKIDEFSGYGEKNKLLENVEYLANQMEKASKTINDSISEFRRLASDAESATK